MSEKETKSTEMLDKTETTVGSDQNNGEESATNQGKKEKQKKQKKQRKKNGKKIALIVIIAIIVLAVAVFKIPALRRLVMPGSGNEGASMTGYMIHEVGRQSIVTTLTGSGTLKPTDSYNVTATVVGDIISADFEEMDEVSEGQVLFVIDSSDIEDEIEEKKKDVSEALEDYNDALEDYKDLKLYSDCSGVVRELYVEKEDRIAEGSKVAYIVDSETMVLEVPFFALNTDFIKKGAKAQVTFSNNSEALDGVVTEISNLASANSTGAMIRNIKIAVSNPGGIYFGMKAYASASGSDGNTYYCSGEGTFAYNEEKTITATASGKIELLNIKEGEKISDGSFILEIDSEAVDSQVKALKKAYDSQLNALEQLEERLDDCTITAPISGTVVQKNYKALDKIGSGTSSNTNLAVIYDMSKLVFEMSIDELDLNKISVGQIVRVTSDSNPGEIFEGVVTRKSIVGNSNNGTTVYPVTVEIPQNDKLLPGMNINAEIILENRENVVAVPVSAVSRGNFVEIATSQVDKYAGFVSEKPETTTVEVEYGASNSEYVEIVSGLNEGDIIVYEIGNLSESGFGMYGGMGGGMGMGMGGMGMPMNGRRMR